MVRSIIIVCAVLCVVTFSAKSYAGDCDCGKIEDNDSHNKVCGSQCFTKEIINFDQVCAAVWLNNACRGVEPKTMNHYRLYSHGDVIGSTQSGYYQNVGGRLQFSTTQPSGAQGNLEVEGGWKQTSSGQCVCIQGAPDTPVSEQINRAKSCL